MQLEDTNTQSKTHNSFTNLIRNKFKKSSKNRKITPDKLDYNSMENYITIDVAKYDGMSYEQALQIAQNADNTNTQFYRYLNDSMGSVGKRAGVNKVLQRYISMQEIKPPEESNVALLNMHRQRTQQVICNEYHNCLMYLILKGRYNNVLDKSIVTPEDYPNILPSQVIEPFQVIETAKTLSNECNENIDKYIKSPENMSRFIFGIRSMNQVSSSDYHQSNYQSQFQPRVNTQPEIHRSQSLYITPINTFQCERDSCDNNMSHKNATSHLHNPYGTWMNELEKMSSS